MSKKIAFYFNSKSLGRSWSLNVSKQALSGTDGTLVQVYDALSKRGEDTYLLCTSEPENINSKKVIVIKDIVGAYNYCYLNEIEFLVYVADGGKDQTDLHKLAKDTKTRLVAWAHCSPSFAWMSTAWECNSFYRLVCVSTIQKRDLVHHPLYKKMIVIPNFFDDKLAEICGEKNKQVNNHKIIVYVGALRPSKGFHHLAKVWPKIHALHPDVKLLVCGSPGLYRSDYMIGPEGIAETEYEKEILNPLGGNRKKAFAMGVEFVGSLPKDALYRAIQDSYLVVVNPNTLKNGSIETFCVSALEAMVLGIPVVGGADGGLLEVVGDRIGGLLIKNDEGLISAIHTLLTNPDLKNSLGARAKERALGMFNKGNALDSWQDMIHKKAFRIRPGFKISHKNLSFYFKSVVRVVMPLSVIEAMRDVRKVLINT